MSTTSEMSDHALFQDLSHLRQEVLAVLARARLFINERRNAVATSDDVINLIKAVNDAALKRMADLINAVNGVIPKRVEDQVAAVSAITFKLFGVAHH